MLESKFSLFPFHAKTRSDMPSGLKKLKLPLQTLGGVPPPNPPAALGGAKTPPQW